MANYEEVGRTSYFKVTDEDRLKEIVGMIPDAELWEQEDGEFAFGAYGQISEYYDKETEDYYEVAEEIQKILLEGEVCIMIESGAEKLRYVSAYATLIFKDKIEHMSLADLAVQRSQEVLGQEKLIKICY